jgi:hypothetical protein
MAQHKSRDEKQKEPVELKNTEDVIMKAEGDK